MGPITQNNIRLYDILYTGMKASQPSVTKDFQDTKSLPFRIDAKDITLAQYDAETKDFITAHKIKDYRRKQFNLLLLPDFQIPIDMVLYERDGWDAEL